MPPKTGAPRSFLIGETVHLRTRVSIPGTRTPTDPATVALTSLRLEGVETLAEPAPFGREAEGEYTLALPTTALAPGTYSLIVAHADGPDRVTFATDQFVLHPA